MKRFNRAAAALAVSLSVGSVMLLSLSSVHGQDAAPTPTPAPAHWEYEGEDGPEYWGDLDPNYASCGTGHAQSPIDIVSEKVQPVSLRDISFDYHPSALNIFNNGHTVQVGYDAGSSITYNEIKYDLFQFHFHHPSEHTIDGKAFDMELHLVHRDARGNLAVVGVLLNQSDTASEPLAAILDHLPAEVGTPAPTDLVVDASTLLPESHLFNTYVGSLTTPPCTEGVRWLVLTTPVDLSAEQVEEFATLFALDARPVQALNNRDLLGDNSQD